MWAVYLGALVVGLGILLAQMIMGDHAHGTHGADGHGGHGKELGPSHIADDAVALLLSFRFWIFFALAFGLSGTLMNTFGLASPLVVGLIAAFAGIGSGLFAALAFRTAHRMSISSTADARDAIGQTGRVLVACSKGNVGQVRVALKGQTVDLMATTDEEAIARGQSVLVEDIRGEIAHVSPRPDDLA